MLAFDTASAVTPAVLKKAKADGVGVVMLYLKYASPALVAMVHAEGLAVGLVWETTATRALAGSVAGSTDGWDAVATASKLGYLPGNVALWFTVDFDAQASQDAAVLAYGKGFTVGCGPQPSGVYGNGAICRLCKVPGAATYSWLAGGSGMRDTQAYLASGEADIVQDVGDKRGEALGISIDSDVAKDATAPWAWHAPPQAPGASVMPDLKAAQSELGVVADGAWGPLTAAAFADFYRRRAA